MKFTYTCVDDQKPSTGTDLLCVDIDGDGLEDIVCSRWWYAAPDWKRYEIPGIYQVHAAYDLDGDGRTELIATRRAPVPVDKNWYWGLSSDFVWIKPIDPKHGVWEIHEIGRGAGSWPHGIAVGPLLLQGGIALAVSYHSAKKEGHFPELFICPPQLTGRWEHRVLVPVPYGEQLQIADVNGDGIPDILMGELVALNDGKGNFTVTRIAHGFEVARIGFSDISGNGLPDVVLSEEVVDWAAKSVPLSRLSWLENPGREGVWTEHSIDTLRCPHSLSVGDLDGDGVDEIVAAEHLPFTPYACDGRLFVYKQTAGPGEAPVWEKTLVHQGFEHHDGTKLIKLAGGRIGIASHGWAESKYVHLWEPVD